MCTKGKWSQLLTSWRDSGLYMLGSSCCISSCAAEHAVASVAVLCDRNATLHIDWMAAGLARSGFRHRKPTHIDLVQERRLVSLFP